MSNYAIISGMMLQIGDQVDQYQIQSHLAQGGMSDIYTAFDLVRRCEVAIKVPDQSMIGDPAQFERFQRELEVLNTLQHPAILRGMGAGKYNRIPYLVTEYVNGKSLRALIDSNSPMPPEQSVPLIKKIAEGIGYCHQNGVIHRDLKPENILVTAEGQPIIMDFGLALTKGSHRVTYSNLSATAGTPDYMAPEQIEGQRGDKRTDIYALGTIFFELLSGKTPFTGDTSMAVMAQHLNGVAPRLDRIIPAVSKELAATIACCLSREPDQRYPDVESLISALDHPEDVDVSILDRVEKKMGMRGISLLQSQAVKAIGISLLIIAGMIALAIALQALR